MFLSASAAWWNGQSFQTKVLLTVIGLMVVCLAAFRAQVGGRRFRGYVAKITEAGFKAASSINHNYGAWIGDLFSSGILIGFGFTIAAKIAGHHSIWFWILLGYAVYSKIKGHLKYSIGSGREFEIFFSNRSGAAAALHKHNEKYPPVPKQGFNYKTSPVTKTFIEGLLENHLSFLHKTLRLGFSRYGRDRFTVSLLIYDGKTQYWHKWHTVYETGTNPKHVRRGSTWPMGKGAFRLDEDMYCYNKYKLYDASEVGTDAYAAVLTIPLYFRRGGQGANGHEKKGELYGAIRAHFKTYVKV